MALARVIASILVGIFVHQASATGSNHNLQISSSGDSRYALLHLPPAAASQTAIPLVVVLHTMAETPSLTVSLTGFSDLADAEGFAVIYPRGWEYANMEGFFPLGIGYTWNAGQCCPKACAKATDDVQFMKDLVAYMKENMASLSDKQFTVDATRVYLSGGSNGGFMTNRIGCQAPDLFAALGPVAGPIADGKSPVWGSDPYECPPLSKPLPAIYFHGTSDSLVAFNGGGTMDFPSVPSYVERMKDRNGIASDKGAVTYTKGDVVCTAYGSVASNFTFCKHSNGHCWPGHTTQGACTTSIDATIEIWEFFKRYTLVTEDTMRTIV